MGKYKETMSVGQHDRQESKCTVVLSVAKYFVAIKVKVNLTEELGSRTTK